MTATVQRSAVVFTLNDRGRQLAGRLSLLTGGIELIGREDLVSAFEASRPIIAICATGIVVRLLAEALRNKHLDPPVVVVAEDGSCVIPILGGHHGGNQLARDIADILGVKAAITTASDLAFGVALNEPPQGWMLANPEHLKAFVTALLAGGAVQPAGKIAWLNDSDLPFAADGGLRISQSVHKISGDDRHLIFHPACLAVGIGCERGVSGEDIVAAVTATLAKDNLSPQAIAGLFSIDIKSDEIGLHDAADSLALPARFFAVERLAAEDHRLITPSDIVAAEVGVRGVAEAAALAAAGADGELIVAKQIHGRVTVAIAQAAAPLNADVLGQKRGHLAIVGIGPGAPDWRTADAVKMIRDAETIIGYSLYLDLITDLTGGKNIRAFDLGAEEIRVRAAIEAAAMGEAVALVSSGDAGIYAMASLAYELLADPSAPASWGRIAVLTTPGITAMQAAAARIGAPLGHDFCAISLSDLLTPRAVIEQRLTAAATGDFVIALYNPVSRRRRDLFDYARECLLAHRPAATPVVLARNLGRAGEDVRLTSLGEITSADIDMLTIVIIGASNSRTASIAGRPHMYTPRGYLPPSDDPIKD